MAPIRDKHQIRCNKYQSYGSGEQNRRSQKSNDNAIDKLIAAATRTAPTRAAALQAALAPAAPQHHAAPTVSVKTALGAGVVLALLVGEGAAAAMATHSAWAPSLPSPRPQASRRALAQAPGPIAVAARAPAAPAAAPELDDDHETLRQQCAFGTGAMPEETLDVAQVEQFRDTIETIVVLMQENRPVDQYFHLLDKPGLEVAGPTMPTPWGDVERLPMRTFCIRDTPHGYADQNRYFNNSNMNGFLTQYEFENFEEQSSWRFGDYFTPDNLTFYHDIFNTFSTANHYYSSLIGPTFPNREYQVTATTAGNVENTFQLDPTRHNIFAQLEGANVTWRSYSGGGGPDGIYSGSFPFPKRIAPPAQFFTDALAGKLPQVVFMDSDHSGFQNSTDEHAPSDVRYGQQFVEKIYTTLGRSPQWPSLAFIVNYDEQGGQYDHMAPPLACPPDDIPPQVPAGQFQGNFSQLGFRVPLLVVSPYAKPNYVSQVVSDHTSVLRFIQARHNLPALTGRDANAAALLEHFDFSEPSFPEAPQLASADFDPTVGCNPAQWHAATNGVSATDPEVNPEL